MFGKYWYLEFDRYFQFVKKKYFIYTRRCRKNVSKSIFDLNVYMGDQPS